MLSRRGIQNSLDRRRVKNTSRHSTTPIMVREATFKLLKTVEDIEVRQYPELVIAGVDVSDGNTYGFSILFNYMSGGNM